MSRIKIVEIMKDVYLLNDNNEATGYVVVGNEKAVLIDTMNGYENVKTIVESITDLPFVVVNTHGHCDHVGGNIFVKEAYIHPGDLPLAKEHIKYITESERYKNSPEKPVPAEWKFILPGDVVDLGDNKLEVYGVPGHTKGCICLLDRKHRILFSGDGIIPHIWMQLDESLPLQELINSIQKLDKIKGEYDMILAGHSRAPESVDLPEQLKAAVQEILDGKTEEDKDYKYFGGIARTHFYDKNELDKQVVYKKY
jgi:glyoxylase-like metal-dependent hydrolase (beta-lactamase superfamily II)